MFDKALSVMEHCEVIDDMKDKQRLLKRILLMLMKDKGIRSQFLALCKELDWKKVYLKDSDRYHFRGKYYKTDYRIFEY